MTNKYFIAFLMAVLTGLHVSAQTITYSNDGAAYKEIPDQEIKNKTFNLPKSKGLLLKVKSSSGLSLKVDGTAFADAERIEGKDKAGTALGTIVTGTLSVNGTFVAGTELTGANEIKMKVLFTSTGFYNISSDIVNGVRFSATGFVAEAGQRDFTLKANGIPLAAGNFSIPISFGGSSQSQPITVTGSPQTMAAISVLASPVLSGGYAEGTEMATGNTITVQVTTTSAGVYDIVTDPVNGVYFRANGKLAAAGTAPVTLKAYGTPIMAGSAKYTLKANGGQSVDQNITYTKAPVDFYVYPVADVAKKIVFSDVNGTSYTLQNSNGSDPNGDAPMIALANTSYLRYVEETYGNTRSTFKVTPYGLLLNSKIKGKDYLYGGPNFVHIFLDEMGSPVMTTIPQGIPEMQYVVHIIYKTENAGKAVSYGISVSGGTFTGGVKIENGRTNGGELNGAADPVLTEYPVVMKTTDSDFDFEIRRFENGVVTKTINYTLNMTKNFTANISVGLINTKLTNPGYSLETDPANTALKVAKQTEGHDRGFGTVLATFYTSPITVIRYYLEKKKISNGNLHKINNPVADFQLHSKDYLYMRPVWERFYPTVGVGLNDKIFQNLFFGINWEFARGGSIFVGGHYGKVNVFNAPEGFEFQKTNLTAEQYNLYQNVDWKTGWAFGASLDFSIITNLFK